MTATLETTEFDATALDALGYAIEARGIDADPVALLRLAHTARDLGVTDILVGLMVDEDQPAAPRIRAFARVSTIVSSALHDDVTIHASRELLYAC